MTALPLAGIPETLQAEETTPTPQLSSDSHSDPDSLPIRHTIYQTEKEPILLGEVTREDILDLFPSWQEEYETYQPDRDLVDQLTTLDQPVAILCVLGTWCHDSDREVSRFWKLLDTVDNSQLTLQMLAVARSADAEQEDELLASLGFEGNIRLRYAIELVPTFIFSAGDDELGRIMESPEESLEWDTVNILSDLIRSPTTPSWH